MWVLKKLNIWNHLAEPEPTVSAAVTHVVEVETPVPAAAPKQEKQLQRKLNLEGEITILDKSLSMGVISNFYRFKAEDVDPELKRGAKVTFNGVYDGDSAFWMATDIKPKPSQLEVEIKERSMYRTVDYKVQNILQDRVIVGPGSGSQTQSNEMKLELTKSDLPKDYPVVVGDWLHLSLVAVESDYGDVQTAKVAKVEFTEKITRVGTITKYAGRYCVDNTIFFTNEIIEGGRTPKLDDRVRVIAIASDQEISRFPHHGVPGDQYVFRKRAISITYENVMSRNSSNTASTNESDDWADEEPVVNAREEYFKELVQDKNKVRIRPNRTISFQSKKLKCTGSKVVTIENLSEKTVFLSRIINNGVQDVAKFELVFQEGPLNTDEMLIALTPHCPWNFEVKCTPYQFGRTKELLTFDFGTFQIGRWLFVHSLAPDQDDLALYMPENLGLDWRKRKLGHDAKSLMVERNMRVISAPQLVRTPFFIPNKIKSYGVPRNLLKCFQEEDEEALLKLYPTIKNELSYKNYLERFQVSLWFEEIENILARKEYDMHDVVLQPDKDGHVISVPRFKEFYPPILMGDPVKVYESLKSAEIYKGTIMKIFSPDDDMPKVLVRFHEKFNRTYDGGPRTIQFDLGRTSYKRMHFAIEHALDYLGPQWLFPLDITLKEPRICFIEDSEDNLHPAITNGNPKSQQENAEVVLAGKERSDKRSRSLWSFQGNVTEPEGLNAVKLKWYNHNLNDEQKYAVRRILKGQGRPLPYIIFGPPGTGKTVTVVEAIMQVYFLEQTSRILVSVPSNAAADLIAEKLVATNRFRPGDFVRLNGFIRSGMSMTNIIADFCEDGEFLDSIAKNRLIISTVTTAGQFFQLNLNTGHFSHVFVDEAGYCTEPETMIPCVLAAIDKQSQVILAGDPEQLGPVLMCDIEFNQILECSFLERLMKTRVYARDETTFPETKYNPAVLTKLVRSYRAHPTLLKLPSKMFYADELVSHAKKEDAYDLSENLPFLPKKGIPLLFHGVDGNCRQEINSPSWFNLGELQQVIYYVKKLRECGLPCEDIGIITPYKKQVEKIRIALGLYLLEDELPKIASVQEFQGGERKVIIISTVRSMSEDIIERKVSRLDFLYSKKRFNVATTRAKALMIIIGNPDVLSRNTYWRQLLEYSVNLGVYTGCHLPKSIDPRWDDIMSSLKKNNIPELVNGSEGTRDSDDEEYHYPDVDDTISRFN